MKSRSWRQLTLKGLMQRSRLPTQSVPIQPDSSSDLDSDECLSDFPLEPPLSDSVGSGSMHGIADTVTRIHVGSNTCPTVRANADPNTSTRIGSDDTCPSNNDASEASNAMAY